MSQLLDVRNPGLWLLLMMVPGLVMLIWLMVHLLRGNAQPVTLVDSPADVEPAMLNDLSRHTIEQLNDMSASLGRALALGRELHEEPHLLTRSPATARGVTVDQNFISLADKMYQLAELTSHLLEKRHGLAETGINPLSADHDPDPGRAYLSFMLDGQRFAISTWNVCAIVEGSRLISKRAVTSKPRGAISFGNALVPVIDLGAYLVDRPFKRDSSPHVVILEVGRGDRLQKIGVVVDAVSGVLRISTERIDQAAGDNEARNAFIVGSIIVDHSTITLLDIERGLLANDFALLRSVSPLLGQETSLT